nr:neprilysin-1-like [Penaeus vannamei]
MSLISFYVYRRNALLVPLGGFMYPLYSSYIPEPLTYATMGVFISHELGHSIDFVGRTRDSLGRANATLWDESTVKDFVERVLCRVNEYSEKHYAINGLLTIAEVMADDGSVINAYMTTQKQLQRTKFPGQLEHLMDQLAMTPDQLFFLYYAQLFCTTSLMALQPRGWSTIHHTQSGSLPLLQELSIPQCLPVQGRLWHEPR